MRPIISDTFAWYNCWKQHCFSRISASIWLRLKLNTTTHLSDATHFLMRPQNVKLHFCSLFCGITSIMRSINWPFFFFFSIFRHLLPLFCQNPSCPEACNIYKYAWSFTTFSLPSLSGNYCSQKLTTFQLLGEKITWRCSKDKYQTKNSQRDLICILSNPQMCTVFKQLVILWAVQI